MANRHFGKIGDIWKHLPLAEVLSIETPLQYWESHAGSAEYPLTRSTDRNYGVFYFVDHHPNQVALRNSAYATILAELAGSGELLNYPGSPLIAMHVLAQQPTHYLFADVDSNSLATIHQAGKALNIEDRLKTIEGDGTTAVRQAAEELTPDTAAVTFVHLDPYRPFLKSRTGTSCIELFGRLVSRGVQTVLWYGFDSIEYRDTLVRDAHDACGNQESLGRSRQLWCGEIILDVFDDPTFDYVPGVLACGVLCAGLSEESEIACANLGEGLVQIYKTAELPNSRSGALHFRSERIVT